MRAETRFCPGLKGNNFQLLKHLLSLLSNFVSKMPAQVVPRFAENSQYPKECHPPLSFTLLPETSPKVLILSLGKPGIPTGHHNLLRAQVVREWPLSSLLHPKGWKTWTSVFIPYHEVNQSKKGHSPLAYGWERMFVPQEGTSQDPRNGRS